MFNLRPTEIASLFCLGLASLGALLRIIAAVRLRAQVRPRTLENAVLPPLTLWRALKPGVPDLRGKLHALVESARPGDQVLIGCDAVDAAVCGEVRAAFADREVAVIVCEPGRAANPKISKFIQIQPHARHAHWLLTDSEAEVTRDFVEGIRAEWTASGADAMTAGYRFANARTFAAQLDTLPATMTLWPGLMLAARLNFTLGACTALRAEDVAAVGGWAAFADELAEDHRLGRALVGGATPRRRSLAEGDEASPLRIRASASATEKRIVLSHHILTLDADPVTLREMLRHQHRVAVTYRVASPLGALGLPVFHCLPLLLAALILGADAVVCGAVAAAWLGSVLATASAVGGTRPRMLVLPLVPFIETACWIVAWFSPAVYWAGNWRAVDRRGRFRGVDGDSPRRSA